MRADWAREPGLSLGAASFGDAEMHDPEIITIVDNGLTEIEPGTATVRVWLDCAAAPPALSTSERDALEKYRRLISIGGTPDLIGRRR